MIMPVSEGNTSSTILLYLDVSPASHHIELASQEPKADDLPTPLPFLLVSDSIDSTRPRINLTSL